MMASNVNETGVERLAGDLKILNKWTFTGALFGLTSAVVYNCLQRRPVIAGIHKHVFAVTIGSYLGYKLGQWQDRKWAERIYLIEAYKQRNPHLFPPDPPKKHGDLHIPFFPRW